MLDKVKLSLKDTFIYGFGNISVKLIGLILLPIYLREFSSEVVGSLSILEVSLQIIINLFSVSLHAGLHRWYWDSKYADKKESMTFTTLVFVTLNAFILIVLFLTLSGPIAKILVDDSSRNVWIIFMALSAGMQLILNVPHKLMRFQGKSLRFSLTNILKFTSTLLFTLYFVLVLDMTLDGVFLGQFLGNLLGFCVNYKFIVRNISFKLELKILKEMLLYSYPLMLSTIATILLNITDKYAIRFISGLSETGVYGVGYKIGNTLRLVIILSARSAIMPLKFRFMENNDKRFFAKMTTYVTFGALIFLLGITIFGYEIIQALAYFSDKNIYMGAYKIIPFITFAMLFESLRSDASFGIKVAKRTHILSYIMIGAAVINVILNIIFIPFFGIIGAAIATLVSQVLFFVIVYNQAQKIYYIPYEFKKILSMIGVSVVLILIAILTNDIGIGFRISLKILLISSFPVLLYFIGFYEKIEIQRISQAWNKWKNPLKWKQNFRK